MRITPHTLRQEHQAIVTEVTSRKLTHMTPTNNRLEIKVLTQRQVWFADQQKDNINHFTWQMRAANPCVEILHETGRVGDKCLPQV